MSPRIPVLMYHKVSRCPPGAKVPFHYVDPSRFEKQLRSLKRAGFSTISCSQMMAGLAGKWDLPGKPIVLTFDDGYNNFLENAVPVLSRLTSTATVFVVSGLIGKTNEWDTRNGDVAETLLDAPQLLQLLKMGHEVGSHSVTHARLSEIGLDAAIEEIKLSKEALGTILQTSIDIFCYPYGATSDDVKKAVKDSGYLAACSVQKGWNDATTDPYTLKRINVRKDTSSPILFWKLWSQSRLRDAT